MTRAGGAEVDGSRLDGAVRAITAHIRGGALGPGDALPSEAAFSRELGMSRAVVREALRSLAALRLIDISAGRRARVAPLDAGAMAAVTVQGFETGQITVAQVYDLRRTVEVRTAQLAALRRTDAQAAAIEAHAEAMREGAGEGALPAVMEHDIAMHETIAAASGNPVFALVVGAMSDVTRRTWGVGWRSRTTEEQRAHTIELHLALARAIKAGDPRRASDVMAEHFDNSVTALIAAGLA